VNGWSNEKCGKKKLVAAVVDKCDVELNFKKLLHEASSAGSQSRFTGSNTAPEGHFCNSFYDEP
jgi:hypothetical protein